MLAELLAGFPAELHFASSRSEAMEVSLRGRFPLCLISHGLSDGSGLPLFPDVFGVADRATGVLLSQHPDLWVIQQALEAGYAAVLGKPPDRQQLADVLRRVFGNVTESWQPGCSRLGESSSVQCDLPGLAEIAGLSNADIRERLSRAELIGIIRAVEYPFAGKERLEYFDRDTLERVVCLVRRWSQQRLERLRSARESDEDSEPSVSMREELAWQGLAVAG
jgi:CheY-like chemotaxis protein